MPCDGSLTSKDGTYCETCKCGFGEPCLKRGCAHCDSPKQRGAARLARRLVAAQAKVERWEKRSAAALSRLLDARADLLRLRRRVLKLDATMDVTDVEALKRIADGEDT